MTHWEFAQMVGAEGWEVVAVVERRLVSANRAVTVLLKRPVPDAPRLRGALMLKRENFGNS